MNFLHLPYSVSSVFHSPRQLLRLYFLAYTRRLNILLGPGQHGLSWTGYPAYKRVFMSLTVSQGISLSLQEMIKKSGDVSA